MQAIKPERKNLIRILARIYWLHMMRQRTVVWDSKCEVHSVRTPFGEVQIFVLSGLLLWLVTRKLASGRSLNFLPVLIMCFSEFVKWIPSKWLRDSGIQMGVIGVDCFARMYSTHQCRPLARFSKHAFLAQLCRKLEGFFQRVLGFYTRKFPKRSAASFTDIPELHLCLWELVYKGNVA